MNQPSPGTAEVVFDAVHLRLGGQEVLSGLDLTINQGETLVLVGRSGAGKSALLKLVNRMLLPDRGRVVVRGRQTGDWDPIVLRRQIGYVVQEIGLFPHMNVRQNVEIVPRLLQWDPDRIAARTTEVLALVGLDPVIYAPRQPHELSGGQRQRVGVARALAGDPALLLMDEPFGALDPVTRSEIHGEFRTIQERVRKTVVMVTHDMAEAFALATRIGVIGNRRLIAVDTPPAIARNSDPDVRPLLQPLFEASEALSKSEG
jgi:osmoprotectant transport system ATP-binding protein